MLKILILYFILLCLVFKTAIMRKVEWGNKGGPGRKCEEKLEWSNKTLQSSQGMNKHI